MAAALLRARGDAAPAVDSAGVYEGWLDPFVTAVMAERAIALDDHEPKAMKSLDLGDFDLIIALTPEAAAEAKRLRPSAAIEVWETANPSDERGNRDQVMAAYRRVRDELKQRIDQRFSENS